MANYNKVLLMGNLTRDPELSYLPSQTAVVEFGLAINRKWKGKDGQSKESTCFIDCRSYGGQAETINKYFSKGKPIFVEGRLDLDVWTSNAECPHCKKKNEARRSKHRVTVENFQFVGSPGGGSGNQGSGGGYGGSGAQGGTQYDRSSSQASASSAEPATPETESAGASDDDIPF